jgi:hypothetical protein
MTPPKVSKWGLLVAAALAVFGVLAKREGGDAAFMLFGPAITLAIRSFLPGLTWGRGVLVAVGGLWLAQIAFVDPDDVTRWAVLVLFGLVFLWEGFKRGKIRWRKGDPQAVEESEAPTVHEAVEESGAPTVPEATPSRSSVPPPPPAIPEGEPQGEWTRLAIILRNIVLGFIAIYALIFFMSLVFGDAWR